MDSVRVTARTVEDAVSEASIQLGTSRDNIEYTVIEKGSSGLFGIIGGKKAIIEAKRKISEEDMMKDIFGDKEEKPKREFKKEARREVKKDTRKDSKKDSKKEIKKDTRTEDQKEEKKDKKEFKKDYRKDSADLTKESSPEKPKHSADVVHTAESAAEPVKADQPSQKTVKESMKDNKKDSAVEFAAAPEKDHAGEAACDPAEESRKEEMGTVKEPAKDFARMPRVPADPAEATRRAEDFLNDLFRAMEMQVEVKSVFENDLLSIDLIGADMGLLIGKRGQTLDSLQYLVSLVVNKGKSSYVRIKLDTEDYRERRKATLENLAKNIAFKVKKTRRPVFLEPMNPYERRIIHSALQNDPYVTTHSEGDEPYRKVVVTLKKDKRQ